MQPLDWGIIAGYFVLLLGITWWVILRNKDTSADYFLAGHSLGWFIVGSSIFASNIGSEHLVGLVGSGTSDGVAMAHYELHAWCLLVLGWVLVPFYARSGVFTMPEFLERRFSPASRYVLPVFIFIVPGMICWGLILKANDPNVAEINPVIAKMDFGEMLADPEDGQPVIEESGKAFPLMVKNVLPTGIRGIVVAGLLSALMSSLAGVFNACSTLFTMDLYSKFRPNASEHQLVKIGRTATVVMVLIGLAWIPVIQGSKGLYYYLQSVQGYLAPPIFVVFFLGIFWKRLNAKGCLAALIVGFALGVFRLAVDTPVKVYDDFAYAEGSFLWIANRIYFQYFSLLIFLISSVVMVVVSYMTSKPDYGKISGLTYGTVTEEHREQSRSSWSGLDVFASIALVAGILAAYLYFRG